MWASSQMPARRIAAHLIAEPVPISVVVPTIRGFGDARPAIDLVVGQVQSAGGEVIVVDGSNGLAPTQEQLGELGRPGVVVWISMPGSSVFQLRYRGYGEARGEIVAVTEDHCHVASDWVERILDAHQRFPDAAAIGGAVLNGTDKKVVDWAAFMLTQGPFLPPLDDGHTDRISGPANVSYKRRVITRLRGDKRYGLIDFLELPEALQGEPLAADDTIRVRHHQSQGFWGTSRAEFDNGRTIAGYRRRRMTRGDWLRIASSPVLPIYRSIRALRIASAKEHPSGLLARIAPAHVWLQYCAMGGELLGYMAGPGDSPKHLF
jgi:hypothetical protein